MPGVAFGTSSLRGTFRSWGGGRRWWSGWIGATITVVVGMGRGYEQTRGGAGIATAAPVSVEGGGAVEEDV